MGLPHLHAIQNTLTAIAATGAIIWTIAGPAAASGTRLHWRGVDDTHHQSRDASVSQNRGDPVTAHRLRQPENKARGQIGDYNRPHLWQYSDGGFDGHSTRITSPKSVILLLTFLVLGGTKSTRQ
jgi:hypothetical protein